MYVKGAGPAKRRLVWSLISGTPSNFRQGSHQGVTCYALIRPKGGLNHVLRSDAGLAVEAPGITVLMSKTSAENASGQEGRGVALHGWERLGIKGVMDMTRSKKVVRVRGGLGDVPPAQTVKPRGRVAGMLALVLLPAGFVALAALASSPDAELEYQQRLLTLAESARELDEEIQALGIDLTASEKDRLSVYLATDAGEIPFGTGLGAVEHWSDVEVRIDGVRVPREDISSAAMPMGGVSSRLAPAAFWSSYVSPGEHDMELTFIGKDAMGKYVEVTQRQLLHKRAQNSEIFVIRLPERSRPVVARPAGVESQARNSVSPSIEWAR